jgi:Kyakuja-Dileera-Zisupton transposase
VFVIDGNFTAVHLRQKHPENDVFLSDGTAYMTGRDRYLKHLRAAEGWVEVSVQKYLPRDYIENGNVCTRQPPDNDRCNDFRADKDNIARRGADVTGIGSLACGRNGLYVPSSTVDFQRGEQ